MITAEQAGLTAAQHTELLRAVNSTRLSAVGEVILTRYAPVWKRYPSPVSASMKQIDAVPVNGELVVVGWDGLSTVLTARLPNEDSAHGSWSVDSYAGLSSTRSLSYSSGVDGLWTIPSDGSGFISPIDEQLHQILASGYDHRFIAAVGPDGLAAHVIGLTNSGNWRLAYYDETTTRLSSIYWPYQVRSFDAERFDDYDVVVIETDLPPIDDFTVQGIKTTPTYQRVQGLVIFKYDRYNHIWSTHYLLDTVDNRPDRSIAHIKLTRYGDFVYATYFKNQNGIVSLCMSRSVDGVNWENPIYLPELGDSSLPLSQHYPMQLVRNGKYMYLIGAGDQGSRQTCFRALATDYMGPAAGENTLDVTDYVTSISVTVENKRSASVTLGDPSTSSVRYGYGLPNLNSGDLIGGDLFADVRAMRMSIRIGYVTESQGVVYVDQFHGVVTKFKESPGLETAITLEAQDAAVMMGAVGNSDANEWMGVSIAGDNFAPLYGDDLTGTTGLGHTVVKTGVWSGSRFESDGITPSGLRHTCNDEEGLAITNLMPRSQNATFSADVDFYHGIDMPVKLPGGSAEDVIDGHEYAGFGFRMKDQYNGWWIRITPRNDNRSDFQLMLRHGETRTIPGVGGEPDTTETYFVDYEVPGVSGTSSAHVGYDEYYVGKVVLRVLYSRISLRHMLDSGTVETIFIYEPFGMGDIEFLVPTQEFEYQKPMIEDGREAWPYTSGYLAYIAKGTGIYVDHGTDAQVESAVTVVDLEAASIYSHGSENYTPQFVNTDARYLRSSTKSIGAITQCGHWQESGFKYEIGRGSIGSPNPTGTPLGLAGVTSLKFKADVWIDSGQDEKATIRAKAKVWYRDGSANSSPVEYTAKQVWNSYECIIENPDNKIIDGITVFFYDPNSKVETEPTTYYVDNIKVMYKETQNYIYFGNSTACSDEHCITVEDAQRTLYAYAGQHDLSFDNLFESGPNNSAETMDLTGVDYFSVPFVADFRITSDYAAFYPLALDLDHRPVSIEINGGQITCSVQTRLLGEPVRIANSSGSAKGPLRIVVNTMSSDGLVYSQDSSLVKDWLTILVYLSDAKILSGAFPIYPDSVFGSRFLWGSENGSMSFDSLRVSVANRVISAFSIDPGETASNPLGRLLGVSGLSAVALPNGGLRIKRAVLSPSPVPVWKLPSTARQAARDIDLMPVSHVRYTAARDDSDVFIRRARAISWAHIFGKRDDANAITSDEMEFGSNSIVAVTRRNMRSIELAITYHPLLEIDDTVGQVDGDLYLLDAMSVTLAPEGSGVPVMAAKYKLSGDWHASIDPDDALAGDWYGDGGGQGGGGEEPPADPYYLHLAALGVDGQSLAYVLLSGYTQQQIYTLHRSSDGSVFEPVYSGPDRFIIDSGLEYNTTYFYRASSPRFDGSLIWSETVQLQVSDSAILTYTFLRGTPLSDSPNVLLAWNDSEFPQIGFAIERTVDLNYGFQQIDLAAGTYYVDETSEYDTTYYYRVRAYDSNGNSEFSTIAVVTTGHEPTHELIDSGTVAMAFTVPGTTTICVAWSDSNFVQTGFELQRGTLVNNGLVFEHLAWPLADETLYTDSGLNWDTVYFYRIRPVNVAGVGRWSNTVSVRTPVESVASPNTVLTARAVPDSQNIYLTWSNSTFDEDGYSIERAETVGGLEIVLEMDGHLTILTDYAPNPNTLYYYRVRPYNSGGYGSYSNVVSVVSNAKPYFPLPPPPLKRIPVLAASQVDGLYSIRLDWTGDVSGYIIQRSSDGTHFSELTLVTGFTYVDDLPQVPAAYWYRVCAYNGNGAGPWSNIVGVSLTSGFTLTGSVQGDLTAALAWTSLPITVDSYEIQGMLSTGDSWLTIDTVSGQTLAYVTAILTEGNTYLYRIVATVPVGEPVLSNVLSLEVAADVINFPTTPIVDDFNRANALLANDIRWLDMTGSGVPFFPASVVGNTLSVTNGVGDSAYAHWAEQVGPDSECYVTIPSLGNLPTAGGDWNSELYINLSVRAEVVDISDNGNGHMYNSGYGAIFDIYNENDQLVGLLQLCWYHPVAGAQVLAEGSFDPATWSDGDSVGVGIVGNVLTSYHKPAAGEWERLLTATDSTYVDAGSLAVEIYHTHIAMAVDDFGGGSADPLPFPATPILDDFNRADSNSIGSNWESLSIARWDETSWVEYPRIADNQFAGLEYVQGAWNPPAVGAYWQSTVGPDCEAYVTISDQIVVSTFSIGVRGQFDPVSDRPNAGYYLTVFHDPESQAQIVLLAHTAPAYIPGASASSVVMTTVSGFSAVQQGDRLGLRAEGNLIKVYYRPAGSSTWSVMHSVEDNTYSSAGKLSLWLYKGWETDRLDDFGGGAL